MFNLFGKKNSAVLEPKVVTKGRSNNEIIEEIHETFYTEVDRLLASAMNANKIETTKQELIDKCSRLKKLGFTNTKEVKEAEVEISRLDNLKIDNDKKKNLIEAINYFSQKYPNYKFITEESVKKICAKYNLIYGGIDRYIGEVPDKNLKHIEDFKVVENDECYFEEDIYIGGMGVGRYTIRKEYKSFEKWAKDQSRKEEMGKYKLNSGFAGSLRTVDMKCPLEIAAPIKDFNMQGMEVKDFKISKIEIPDPIVLKPVIFNNQKHYLIVTAWGIEASDEIVVNEKMN